MDEHLTIWKGLELGFWSSLLVSHKNTVAETIVVVVVVVVVDVAVVVVRWGGSLFLTTHHCSSLRRWGSDC